MRKTLCSEHKRYTLSLSEGAYFECVACGAWEIVNGKAVRVVAA